MKFKKGTFVVVPNKEYLKGKPSEMQCIYFWLCEHSDDSGKSFPTRQTIADEAGCALNTTDKYLKQLVEDGFITSTQRFKPNSQELTSNIYQVLLLNAPPKARQPSITSGGTGSPKTIAETNPSINQPNLTNKKPEVLFSYEIELNKLGDSNWKPNKIIYNYFKRKEFVFENQKQFKSAIGRELRSAISLEGYNSTQINKTMDYCEENYKDFGWSLATVAKRIINIANIK